MTVDLRGEPTESWNSAGLVSDPEFIFDLEVLVRNYFEFQHAVAADRTFFAVKCNSHPAVLLALHDIGCEFDVASGGEIELLERLAVDVQRVAYTAPFKAARDIQIARTHGVSLFVADTQSELNKIASAVPGAEVLIRLAVESYASRWPLSAKFGCLPSEGRQLVQTADQLGLRPIGYTFHVGSQSESPDGWRSALKQVGDLMRQSISDGIELTTVDLGGGFPAPYHAGIPRIHELGKAIRDCISSDIPFDVQVFAEPGRALVADMASLVANVIGVAQRPDRTWAFCDVGVFSGLHEMGPGRGELAVPITHIPRSPATNDGVLFPVSLAGPSCDGDDVLGFPVDLPECIAVGDQLQFHLVGAYSFSYLTRFCGLSHPSIHLMHQEKPPTNEGYEVIRTVDGEEAFIVAGDLERSVFSREGFVEDDGTLSGFASYDESSVFNLILKDGQPVGALREIWPSQRGFKTANDFELPGTSRELIGSIGHRKIVEIGTVAVLPEHRSGLASLLCYASAYRARLAWNVSHWIASIDDGLLRVFRSAFFFCFEDLGPSMDYYGSPTTPVILNVDRASRELKVGNDEIFELIVGRKYPEEIRFPTPIIPRGLTLGPD